MTYRPNTWGEKDHIPAEPTAMALRPGSPIMPESQPSEELEPGYRDAASLSLSGGGYRAMVFHVGALWRLNQCGLLEKLKRISSVSGGSITAGVLGLCWNDLDFRAGVATRFDLLVSKIRQMSETS